MVIQRVRAARPAIKRCYMRTLGRRKRLWGKSFVRIVFRFTIRTSGRVENVQISSALGPRFDNCLEKQVRTWRFKPFGGFARNFRQRVKFVHR